MLIEAYKALLLSEHLLKQCVFSMTESQFNQMLEHCLIIAEHGEYDDKKSLIDLVYDKKEKTTRFPALITLTENLTKIVNYFIGLCSPTFDNYLNQEEQIENIYTAPAA